MTGSLPSPRDMLRDALTTWPKLAAVRERKNELDVAYQHPDSGRLLLMRYCPSITARRLDQAMRFIDQGDFAWIVLVTVKAPAASATPYPPQLLVLSAAELADIVRAS